MDQDQRAWMAAAQFADLIGMELGVDGAQAWPEKKTLSGVCGGDQAARATDVDAP
jgi:hypothetical protein